VQAGQPVKEDTDQHDQHDDGDDDNRWAGSRLGLFLDDSHVWIVPRPLEQKQPSRSRREAFLTDL
jgi:hypothetical protein